jgi:hypothetical protein
MEKTHVLQIQTAQHSVQLTSGTRRVFWAFCVASGLYCSQTLSTLPPTAANASRWTKETSYTILKLTIALAMAH